MRKHQYNQGDLLQFDNNHKGSRQLAVVIGIFFDKGQHFYEMRWATSGDRFTGNIIYIDDNPIWTLYARGQ